MRSKTYMMQVLNTIEEIYIANTYMMNCKLIIQLIIDLFRLGDLLVVLLGETEVSQELRIDTLHRRKLMLLNTLDTVSVGLAGLVVGLHADDKI